MRLRIDRCGPRHAKASRTTAKLGSASSPDLAANSRVFEAGLSHLEIVLEEGASATSSIMRRCSLEQEAKEAFNNKIEKGTAMVHGFLSAVFLEVSFIIMPC